MAFIHALLVVNRTDLLRRAVESVRPLWPIALIIDNSPLGNVASEEWPVPVVRPSVPLSVAQSMNFLTRLAAERGCSAFGYQHNDAEVHGDGANHLLEIVNRTGDKRWASILTNYDVFSAYNMAAVQDVGPWDTDFPMADYRIDVDWFYRARTRGWEILQAEGIEVTHHLSQTCASDPARMRRKALLEPFNDLHYRHKWGGTSHEEAFVTPFNE